MEHQFLNRVAQPDLNQPDLKEEACWQAVLGRDEYSAGAFVYGVRSTLIFCRPSCPSRRPQREQVRFFALPELAVKAGFRPCKRCRPDQPVKVQVARVQAACRLIEAHLDKPLSLAELSRQVGGSSYHLQRTFKQVTGITPREYADALRLGQLKTKLQDGETVLGALYDAGYGSSRGLYERAPAQLGMTPATYQRGGKGANIIFSIAPCPLGLLLVAATQKGICAVSLGDSAETLEVALHKEFPAAEVRRDEAQLHGWLQALLRFLEGQEPHLDLPLDVQATAFQRRVWQVLHSINYGETRTYAQVAAAGGQPTAVRAVARACATNPVALVVPCHRVVRGDGSLGGYRWGLERKKKLLAQERNAVSRVAIQTASASAPDVGECDNSGA
ncbi:MAG TPA: bifunctional DNA-binding transcriptional regulator/O6-methylguanine-DNA methyltransferase Ada [Abditibacteriaceae bacterium]|nr:bifunctional DNA-binding transcriptional regulator/O6-methylguanine-DNA methyltransferase Ada [Abditibacteriaceae bacterium]